MILIFLFLGLIFAFFLAAMLCIVKYLSFRRKTVNEVSILHSTLPLRSRSRSMGVKLIVVCALALLMMIPSFFVNLILDDRTTNARTVVQDISSHVGGQQTFLGPTLAVPYTIPPQTKDETAPTYGTYLIFPAQASAVVKTTTEERHRSLFRVPVFQADLQLDADFDITKTAAAAPQFAQLDWSRAEIIVGVTDPRGALADATLTTAAKTAPLALSLAPPALSTSSGADPAAATQTVKLAPSSLSKAFSTNSDDSSGAKLSLFGTPVGDQLKPGTRLHVSSTMRFSGAERIALLAYGQSTRFTAQGDWRNPGFDGYIPPVSRSVSDKGFAAEWSVPYIARGVPAEGSSGSMSGLGATALGISFVEVADPYQSVNRSLKYVILFLGLVFLSYFVFEATTGKRVHPAQYILVGMAQIVFYLLLLSFAERVGFDYGFLIAGVSTVTLLALNAGWIFASKLQAMRAFAVFALLYLCIYFLLRLEDNALMLGAIMSFLSIAAAMYFTRKIDWYGSLSGKSPEPPPMPVPPTPTPPDVA